MSLKEGRVSQWLVYATGLLVLAFPTLVLVMPSGDSFVFTLLAIFSLIAYAQDRVRRGFSSEEKTYFLIVAVFFLAALLNYLITGTNNTGLKKLTRYLYFLMIFPFMALFLRTQLRSSYIWGGLVLGAIAAGLVGVYEWISLGGIGGDYTRVGGALNPIRFGGISMFLAAASLVAFVWFRRARNPLCWLMIPASLLGLLAAVASATRGAWVILPFYALVLVVAYWNQLSSRLRLVVVGVFIATPLLMYFVPQTHVADRIDDAKQDLTAYMENSNDVNPGNVRLEMWRNAYQLFSESPVLGAGLGNYLSKTRENIDAGLYHPMIADFKNPHNAYMSALSTQGIAGMVLTIMVIAWPIKFGWSHVRQGNGDERSTYGLTIVLLAVGYLILMLTNDLMDVKAPVMFFVLVIAQFMYLMRSNHEAGEAV